MFPLLHGVLSAGDAFIAKWLGYSPIAYWPLNDLVGSSFTDYSGNGFDVPHSNVTLGGGTFTNGMSCATFNGTSSYADVYSAGFESAWNKAEYTLACFFKHSGSWNDGQNRDAVYLATNATNRAYHRKTAIASGEYRMTTNRNVTEYQRGVVSTSNGWLFLAHTVSVSNDEFKAFDNNGALIGAAINSVNAWVGALNSDTCLIGARSKSGTGVFNGAIAHVGVFPLLSEAAIADLATV